MSAEVFAKFHLAAAHSGLYADLGAELTHTLLVLASFMDANGRCWPTQDLIAHRLGTTRVTATRRIQRLLAYRWRGGPIVTAERRAGRGGYRNEYRILPESGFSIF